MNKKKILSLLLCFATALSFSCSGGIEEDPYYGYTHRQFRALSILSGTWEATETIDTQFPDRIRITSKNNYGPVEIKVNDYLEGWITAEIHGACNYIIEHPGYPNYSEQKCLFYISPEADRFILYEAHYKTVFKSFDILIPQPREIYLYERGCSEPRVFMKDDDR